MRLDPLHNVEFITVHLLGDRDSRILYGVRVRKEAANSCSLPDQKVVEEGEGLVGVNPTALKYASLVQLARTSYRANTKT